MATPTTATTKPADILNPADDPVSGSMPAEQYFLEQAALVLHLRSEVKRLCRLGTQMRDAAQAEIDRLSRELEQERRVSGELKYLLSEAKGDEG